VGFEIEPVGFGLTDTFLGAGRVVAFRAGTLRTGFVALLARFGLLAATLASRARDALVPLAPACREG